MENRLVPISRLDSFDTESFVPALRAVLLGEEISETLADMLFKVLQYAKGTGPGFLAVPETEAARVRAEIRRELVLEDNSPLTEMYEHLYKRLGEAAPRR